MDYFLAIQDILGSALGSLFVAAANAAIIGIGLYWNIHEYRTEWRDARLAWWVAKLALPVCGVVMVGIALFVVRDTSGFVGLGVFYTAIGVWLIAGPIITALLITLIFGVGRLRAFMAALSMMALLFGGWFGGAGMLSSIRNVTRPFSNFDQNLEYKAFQKAADKPMPAGDAVQLKSTTVFGLPDGRRLLHLAYVTDPDLQLYRLEVLVPTKAAQTIWSGTLGHCLSESALHVTNVLDHAQWFELRATWHRGNPDTMIGIEQRIESSPDDAEQATLLDVRVYRHRIEAPIPIPEEFVRFKPVEPVGREPLVSFSRSYGHGAFNNQCLYSPITIPVAIESAQLTFYSEELYKHLHYRYTLEPD